MFDSTWCATQRDDVFCVQDGRDGAVAAAESGRPGADRCGHGGHHEGLQGKVPPHEGMWSFDEIKLTVNIQRYISELKCKQKLVNWYKSNWIIKAYKEPVNSLMIYCYILYLLICQKSCCTYRCFSAQRCTITRLNQGEMLLHNRNSCWDRAERQKE